MKYAVNLVRNMRADEKKREQKQSRIVIISVASFGILILSLMFGIFEVFRMIAVIDNEKTTVARIEQEYSQYTKTNTFVDKSDIELLDKLQNKKIFWTKKIAAMAQHLPENYWITQFGFEHGLYTVMGYGYITPNQEQLVTIDEYLNLLRTDRLFSDVFKNIYLKSTGRTDVEGSERVAFEYVAEADTSVTAQK
jgi:hypothetical protein